MSAALTPATRPIGHAVAIHSNLLSVMADVGVVGKWGKNKHDKYEFRRAEDVMNALHPALVRHGVLVIPTTWSCDLDAYTTKGGTVMNRAVVRVEFRFIAAEDGSSLSVFAYGEGADVGDKSVNKAHTSALKTAICQGLMIPTEAIYDAEADSPTERAVVVDDQVESPVDDAPMGGPATDADLDRIMDAIKTRCDRDNLDPDSYSPVIMADVLNGTGWTWETVPDIPRREIGWICSTISIWEESDTAPGFVAGEIPPQEAA